MSVEIITKEDLNEFRRLLIADLSTLLEIKPQQQQKKWLKSNEVRKLLNISPGTLQNLRINGTLIYSRVAASYFMNPPTSTNSSTKTNHEQTTIYRISNIVYRKWITDNQQLKTNQVYAPQNPPDLRVRSRASNSRRWRKMKSCLRL